MLEERTCPLCGEIYSPPIRFCNRDGKELISTNSLIGRILHDKYRLDDWLGGGGMATVYRATHLKIQEEVAVKVLNPEMMGQERIADRFRNEAKATMRINHPNAIRVTDFDITDDNLHYLVMEIVRGKLLRDLIKDRPFGYRSAVKLLCQTCEAIYAAHNQRIIHRDLKPDNIIVQNLGGEETIKVLDFGIARLREGDADESAKWMTKPGTVIGTLAYMSPEQCRGEELGASSDIYSLGVIAYEMLSQRTPFIPTDKWNEFVKRLQLDPAPPLRLFAPDTPPSVEHVIMKALEKSPDLRPPSALIMSKWLQKAVREAEGRDTDPRLYAVTEVDEPRRTGELSQVFGEYEDEEGTIRIEPPLSPPAIDRVSSKVATPAPIAHAAPKFRAALIVAAVLAVVALAGWWYLQKQTITNDKNGQSLLTFSDAFGDMILIPGGKFKMGDAAGSNANGERPAHEVEVKEFFLDKHEVTNQQYKKFIDASNRNAPSHWNGKEIPPGEAALPITRVTWEDASAFAAWAKKRLPTEAEWEYAARSGSKEYLYPWGNDWGDGLANANLGRQGPSPVTSFAQDRNEFGVLGLAGNVSEWVEDLHLRYDSRQPVFANCPDCRVYRGGNFKATIGKSSSTRRWSDHPTTPLNAGEQDVYKTSLSIIGFRCAKTK